VSRTWYLGLEPGQVAESCVLVGDPGRIDLFATRLDRPCPVSEQRGLRVLTGRFRGEAVTVASFGMGGPLAAIVVEELAQVGVRVFLRAGTAMALDPAPPLGGFFLAEGALREEGTSHTYLPASHPARADPLLTERAEGQLIAAGCPYRRGLIASCDGFYTEMFALDEEREPAVRRRTAGLRRMGAGAVDMETATVLVVAAVRGARAASLCLLTVEAATRRRLEQGRMRAGEELLSGLALATVIGGAP